jgi:hypothetical protein
MGFLSNQNFVEYLTVKNGESCLSVIRLEDESLGDLGDLVLEVFDSRAPPEGCVLLLGSTFFLHKVGVTAYAATWTSLVEMLKNKWKGVMVCLLIPIIRED